VSWKGKCIAWGVKRCSARFAARITNYVQVFLPTKYDTIRSLFFPSLLIISLQSVPKRALITFIPKHIHLPLSQRIKICHQTDTETALGEGNGFFDPKLTVAVENTLKWKNPAGSTFKVIKNSNGSFIKDSS
jgi:hypothetical protein